LVGAVVTFGGLWIAWLRAKHGETIRSLAKRLGAQITERVARMFGASRGVVISTQAASLIGTGSTASVFLTFNVANTVSTAENLERLADFVNRLSGNTIPHLEQQIVSLRGDIKDARAYAADLVSQTVTQLQEQINHLEQELDSKQVLDLRWAIYGLLITVGGIALGLGT
jgi:hypothetical protein